MSKLVHSRTKRLTERMGGETKLFAFQEQVAALTLPACPFCGGEAEVVLLNFGMDIIIRVRCHDCHSAAVDVSTGYDVVTMEPVGIYAALKSAVDRWSRRAVSV